MDLLIVFVVNLIITIVIFAILWQLLQLVLRIAKIGISPEIRTIVLLLFLLVVLFQALGLVGIASPHLLLYRR